MKNTTKDFILTLIIVGIIISSLFFFSAALIPLPAFDKLTEKVVEILLAFIIFLLFLWLVVMFIFAFTARKK